MSDLPASAPAVHIDDLVKSFPTRHGRLTAVDHLDLRIEPGELVAFLGPNGAGKTTTLDVLMGLTSPTAGGARIFGHAPREAVALGLIGATLQEGTIGPNFTVAQTLHILASLHAAPLSPDSVMERTHLTPLASRKVSKLSGGERQRLRLAAALLPDPQLLILDEPTTGMDVTARADFWDTMRALAHTRERTILFATHYLTEASDFADRIVIMNRGRIAADGSIEELRAAHESSTLTATWPGIPEQISDAAASEALESLLESVADSVTSLGIEGGKVTIRTKDSDAVARLLLTRSPITGLAISPVTLDDVFTQLVSE